MTPRVVATFLAIFVTPGLLILIFARRMVDYNARSFPRVYGPVVRAFTLILFYLIGLVWLAGGIVYLMGL